MRFKRLRVFLDDLNSLMRGWYFDIPAGTSRMRDTGGWRCLADFPTTIRQREHLGEMNVNRVHNMKLCCEMIDGLALRPGEIFSLRKTVGEPAAARGFRKGPVIIRGKLSFSAGGGLCQVSTALFNAALLANFAILQKYNHSTDIWGEERFIDLGKDAVYVYGRRDLKFRNTHGREAVIRMSVDEPRSVLNCSIHSPAPLDGVVRVDHVVLSELSPETATRREKDTMVYRKGWVVLTRRTVLREGAAELQTYRNIERYEPAVLDNWTEGITTCGSIR